MSRRKLPFRPLRVGVSAPPGRGAQTRLFLDNAQRISTDYHEAQWAVWTTPRAAENAGSPWALPPRAPTDPDVPNSGIRLVKSWIRNREVNRMDHPRRRQREPR